MLKKKDPPFVFFSDSAVFTDHSLSLLDYINNSVTVTMETVNDFWFFGRYKPFNTMYIEITTANTNASVLTVEYFDTVTNAFKAVEQLLDETSDGSATFAKSGFIHFKNPNIAGDTGNQWIENTVNSQEIFWLRLSVSATMTATTIKGWNIVFSDDNDLEREFPGITAYRPSTEVSFIKYHVAARDQMVSAMRRDGKLKVEIGVNNSTGLTQPFEAWDFLEPEEVNAWATHLALSNFWAQQSTETDDKFDTWSRRHSGLADDFKDVFYLTLDTDDDGAKDVEERNQDQSSGVVVRR